MVAEILGRIWTVKLSPLDFLRGYWGTHFFRQENKLQAVLYPSGVVEERRGWKE